MPRRRSAGGPAVTAGAPAGRRRMPRNPVIMGRSPFGHRAAIEGFDTDVIWTWTFNICMIIVIVHNFLLLIIGRRHFASIVKWGLCFGRPRGDVQGCSTFSFM